MSISVNTNHAAGQLPPLPTGKYKIFAPDYPHSGGYTNRYQEEHLPLKCHQVWFSIEYESNNRYIHIGAISAGCMTVLGLDKWNGVYDYLISHRDKTGMYVRHYTLKS